MLTDLSGQHLRIDAHGRDIEGIPVLQLGRIGLHQIDDAFDRIGHIHHVHKGALVDKRGVSALLDGIEVDMDRIVGRSAAGQRFIRDDPGIADATGIDAKAFEVVVTQELTRHLRDPVDRAGALDGVLWRLLERCARAKGGDRGRGEDFQVFLSSDLEHIVETAHIDGP